MKLDVARLDSLLVALRGAGLVVGVEEVTRCRQVLALWGSDGAQLSLDRWSSLLATVLVKTSAQRSVLSRVLEQWLDSAVVERYEPLPATSPPPRMRKPIVGFLVFVLVLGWISSRLASRPLEVEGWRENPLRGVHLAPDPTSEAPQAVEAVPKVWMVVLPRNPEVPWPGWKELLLGLLMLAWAGKVAADVEARPLLPPSTLTPRVEGPTRVLLSTPATDLSILEPTECDAIVWSVGSFVSEVKTARVDLRATVRATAKAAGRLELCFVPQSGHREVWLWLDESATDPQLRRVADEVEQALRRYGLPVERAYFRGLPELLYSGDGRRFRPREIEERRGDAQVAILSDGRLLGRRLEGHDRQPIESTFRELGCWPQLAFFLPDSASAEVHTLAARHQVEVRRPAELVTFLSAIQRRGRKGGRDLDLWAAVCALSPAPVDDGSAEALRRDPELKIEASPWQLEDLRTKTGAEVALAGRLEWGAKERRKKVEWLRGVELGETTVFDRALRFWIDLYDSELKKRRSDTTFTGTLAEAQLRAERALLALVVRGKEAPKRRTAAIEELFQLHQAVPVIQGYLEKKLGELDTADATDLLKLDFEWKDLSAVQQHQLVLMRFGGRKLETRLRLPRRAVFFLSLAAGLTAGVLFLSFRSQVARMARENVESVEIASFPEGGQIKLDLSGESDSKRLEMRLKSASFSWHVAPGTRVMIDSSKVPNLARERRLNSFEEKRDAVSHAADENYLLDQINLRLQFKDGAQFIVSTRPGEFVYITKRTVGSTEKRLSFVIMPAPLGERSISREELRRRPRQSIGFRFLPYCLNAASSPVSIDRSSSSSCLPRIAGDIEEDFIFPLSGLLRKDIAAGESFYESGIDAHITVLDYRSSGFSGVGQFDPFLKCCKESEGIEVCGCFVSTEGSACTTYCPVSE